MFFKKNIVKKILFLLILITSCKGYNSTIIEKQKSVTEVCPTCVLTRAIGSSRSEMWIAQDTAKNPNVVYEVTFCYGFFEPIYKVNYITKFN